MALLVVLGACGGESGTSSVDTAADEAYGTREVTDCTGFTSTFTSAPDRAVTVTTSVLEFLVRMGLEDRVVGTQAAAPGAFPDDVAAVADGLPKLGGEYVPGNFVPIQREALLTAEPDVVIGGWPSNFDATKGALSQQELSDDGIPSYFALSASCSRTEPITDLSVVFQDVENYGLIFDAEDEAEELIGELRATLDGVADKVADVERPAVFTYSWDDGRGEAYSTGNQHLGNAIINLAGGRNIFDDVDAVYGQAGWEEVVSRNPDVIIIEVFGKPTPEDFDAAVAEAKEFFTSDPALRNVTAVRNEAFFVVQQEAFYVGGVRNADTVEQLARFLHPDAFGE